MHEWEGREVKNLEVSFAVSVAGSGMIQRFRELCGHIVHKDKVFFHSALLLQHVGIRTLMPQKSDYVLVHVHGELTDVVVTENGDCVFFGSFPVGINTIIRFVGKESNISENTADSMVTLFSGGYLEKIEEEKTVHTIDEAVKKWNDEFAKLLAQAGHAFRQFHAVVVTARLHEEFFVQSFKRAHPEAKIEPFTEEDISGAVSFEEHTEVLRLTGLYTLAINSLSS